MGRHAFPHVPTRPEGAAICNSAIGRYKSGIAPSREEAAMGHTDSAMMCAVPRLRLRSVPFLVLTALAAGGCGTQEPEAPSAEELAARAKEVAATNRAEQVVEAAERRKGEIARLETQVRRAKRERAAVDAQSSRSTGAAATASRGALLSRADRSSFRRLEAQLGGRSGVAVAEVGLGQPVSTAGSFQSAVAWSTSKVPVAMAAIAAGSTDTAALARAITASDNAAAETLWSGLGGGDQAASAADAQLRAGGDETTRIEASVVRPGFTAFGQTSWALEDQTAFTAGMECTAPGRKVLALMARTIPAQRWGLGATRWSASIKGGWGPGDTPGQAGGYIDRQMGLLESGGRKLAVTIMTQPSTGTHEAGTASLTKIARWVVSHVDRRSLAGSTRC
jgi:hypothetical protein